MGVHRAPGVEPAGACWPVRIVAGRDTDNCSIHPLKAMTIVNSLPVTSLHFQVAQSIPRDKHGIPRVFT